MLASHALPFAACLALLASGAFAAESPAKPTGMAPKAEAATSPSPDHGVLFAPENVESSGSVTVEGHRIDYRAVAGTIVVHPKGWDDTAFREHDLEASESKGGGGDDDKTPKAEASMFFVAYFAKGAPSADRPITFLYNGGPGSSTVWLHMGAFGPRRVQTADDSHTPAAPYRLLDNAYSLLDASDLVFVDAPGTGFSRIAGRDKEKAFFGADPDAYAFEEFITGFLSRFGRWNSPKYLFGESYGTPRSAMVVNGLETQHDIDFNGVILLSQILNFDLSADEPGLDPGTDEAYIVSLPTYAASAWYHDRVAGGRPADFDGFIRDAEAFAIGDYAGALQAGAELDPARRQAIAEKMSHFTGLPAAYLLKADLRVDAGMFEKTLQEPAGLTTGRLDTRFSGPDIDPLSKEAGYDPQSAAISSAYVAAFNDYVRKELGYGEGKTYKPRIDTGHWSFAHQPPGARRPFDGGMNVMPDLAYAMKYNPQLKVMTNSGYFDLATPFFEAWYEMHHLQIPAALQGNIEYHDYRSGHMVYAHEAALKELHDNVADFIRRTENLTP